MRFRSRQNGERNNTSNKGNYSLDCNCIEINFYSFIQFKKKKKTKKAFNLVDHKCLLHKLEPYGVRDPSYNRFLDYLCTRSQRVKFGKELSSSLPLDYGVPQGSLLLDPLLSACCDPISACMPDTVIYTTGSESDCIMTEIQEALQRV